MPVTVAQLDVKLGSNTRDLDRGLASANRSVQGFGKSLAGVGSVAGGFILGGAIQAMVGSVASLTRGAFEFEAQMANVNSIAQLSTGELKALSAEVNALAGATAQAPQALAAGLYDIYSSGFQGAAALEVLEAAANAATAGLTGTDVAARAITQVMNAYGQEVYTAAEISDVLFQVVNDGVITFEQIANNMGNTLPLANALGISIYELGAAYAQMTLQGVNASAAETQIASLMRAAANPTEALTAATQAYGYETTQALLAAEGMPGLLKAIDQAANGNSAALYEMLGTQEAVNAAMILGTDGAAAYVDEVTKMQGASDGAGATQTALAKQMESAAFRMRQAKIAIQQAATAFIGALAPAIAKAAQGFTFLVLRGLVPLIDGFGRVIAPIGRFIGTFDDVFASGQKVSTILDEIFGTKALGGPMMGSVITTAGGRLRDLATDILTIVDSFGDLARAFQQGGVGEVFSVLGEELATIGDAAASAIGTVVDVAVEFVVDTVLSVAGWLWEHRDDIWGGIKDLVGWTTDTFTDAVTATIDGTIALAGDVGDAAGDLWGWIKGQLFPNESGGATSGEHALGDAAPFDLGTVALQIADWAITALVDLGTAMKEQIEEWWPSVAGAIGDAWDAAVTIGSWSIDAVTDLGTAVAGKVSEWWDGVPEAIGSAWDAALAIGSWTITAVADLGDAVYTKVAGWWASVQDELGSAWDLTVSIGTWIAQEATQGSLVTTVTTFVQEQLAEANIEITHYTLTVGTPDTIEVSIDFGAIWDNIVAGLIGGPDSMVVSEDQEANERIRGFGRKIGEGFVGLVVEGLKLAFTPGGVGGEDQEGDPSTIGGIIYSLIAGMFEGVWDEAGKVTDGFMADAELWRVGVMADWLAFEESIVSIFAGDEQTSGVGAGAHVERVGGLWDELQGAFDGLTDLSMPDLPDWLTDFEWLTGPINTLVEEINEKAGDLREAWQDLQFWKGQASDIPPQQDPRRYQPTTSSQPGSINGEPVTALPAVGAGPTAFSLPAPDLTAFNAAIAEAAVKLSAFRDGDWQATLDADTGPAALAYTDVMTWGGVWGESTFAATFDIDTGPAALAYTSAFGWGNTWESQVFTARFSIDTSPLQAAYQTALQVAQDIRDIMPSSPAKKGPLSTPISFGYIADELASAMSRLAPIADQGLGAAADRLGRRLPALDLAMGPAYGGDGAAGHGAGAVINLGGVRVEVKAPIYGVDDLEGTILDTFTGKVVPALETAIARRERSLGVRA